ncbi:hypothetical protein TWF694_005443 [Orbilia ellipsospora]|uniref:Uncharacterized protein n=1 Tax=Orbilia ellipsospora TaxID=2528407 RepID=A0AAV9WT64_9PEZI
MAGLMERKIVSDSGIKNEHQEQQEAKEELKAIFKPPSGEFKMEGYSTIKFDSKAVKKAYSSSPGSSDSEQERVYKVFKMTQELAVNDEEEEAEETEAEKARRRLLKGKFPDQDLHPTLYSVYQPPLPDMVHQAQDELLEEEYDPVLFEQIWARNSAENEKIKAQNEITALARNEMVLVAENQNVDIDDLEEGGVSLTNTDLNIDYDAEVLPSLPTFNRPSPPQEQIRKALRMALQREEILKEQNPPVEISLKEHIVDKSLAEEQIASEGSNEEQSHEENSNETLSAEEPKL